MLSYLQPAERFHSEKKTLTDDLLQELHRRHLAEMLDNIKNRDVLEMQRLRTLVREGTVREVFPGSAYYRIVMNNPEEFNTSPVAGRPFLYVSLRENKE